MTVPEPPESESVNMQAQVPSSFETRFLVGAKIMGRFIPPEVHIIDVTPDDVDDEVRLTHALPDPDIQFKLLEQLGRRHAERCQRGGLHWRFIVESRVVYPHDVHISFHEGIMECFIT